jgi:hypothetical protein
MMMRHYLASAATAALLFASGAIADPVYQGGMAEDNPDISTRPQVQTEPGVQPDTRRAEDLTPPGVSPEVYDGLEEQNPDLMGPIDTNKPPAEGLPDAYGEITPNPDITFERQGPDRPDQQ